MKTTGGMTSVLLTSAGMILAAALSVGAGCTLEPNVPGDPTYEADVKPILEARCIRCHSYPQLELATAKVSFDVYECPPAVDGGIPCALGAKGVAGLMAERLMLSDDAPTHMPPKPAAPLSKYQVDTIVKWAKEMPAPLER